MLRDELAGDHVAHRAVLPNPAWRGKSVRCLPPMILKHRRETPLFQKLKTGTRTFQHQLFPQSKKIEVHSNQENHPRRPCKTLGLHRVHFQLRSFYLKAIQFATDSTSLRLPKLTKKLFNFFTFLKKYNTCFNIFGYLGNLFFLVNLCLFKVVKK